ncbi:acyltransferase family protein [Glaciecola sp. MH2013]|uniref:acyltransferase family protein n=1 Tax=Glaciecola sp. MH2013 TaxID=2785524 RepID=UPI00189FB665|nr:acyltransferase family protein [Glaciecola sp. MH2013]MBF7072155.1 acyltransferase family protein [Glaciecola sp. MH2013]
MKSILAIIAFLIIYGSLYPFSIEIKPVSEAALAALLNFDVRQTGLTDLIANIVLFVPMGMFIRGAFPRVNSAFQLGLLFIAVFAFAYGIQALQLFTLDRKPWGGDAIWNMVGYVIGLLLHSSLRFEFVGSFQKLDKVKQISLMLACAIILLELAPFAPSIDFDILKQNIKSLLQKPSIDWYWTFENTVFWLVAFYLLHVALPVWVNMRRLSIVAATVLAAKFFIIANNINLASLVAVIIALLIWSVFWQVIKSKNKSVLNALTLAVLLLASIIANGLYPFEISDNITAFKWLPFSGSMNGNLLLNIVAFAKKLVFYGGAIWLLYLHYKHLIKAMLICAAVVLFAELLQMRVDNSIAESTDIFLAAMVGFAIFKWLNAKTLAQVTDTADVNVQQHTSELGALNDETQAQAQASAHGPGQIVPSRLSSHKNYIEGLDGLRAIAAFAVFMVHFQQFSGVGGSFGPIDFERWMINGNTGVGLFFILSGFLLSMPFWQAFKDEKRPSIKAYFINRAARIIPLYYACLFGLLALKGFSGPDAGVNNIFSHLLFLHNLKDYQVMSLNPPFWTLAVEFQFYLLLPFIFLILLKLKRGIAVILLSLAIPLIYIAYRAFMQKMALHSEWPIIVPLIWPLGIDIQSAEGQSLTYSLFAHLPHFLLGVLSANFFTKSKSKLAELSFWGSCLFVFLILATSADDDFQWDFGRYNFPFIPILLAIMVLSVAKTRLASAILETWILRWMGLLSYGIYLFHYPIQKAVKQVIELAGADVQNQSMLFFLLSLILTLVVSYAAYKLIERPVIAHFKQQPNKALEKLVNVESNEQVTSTAKQTLAADNSDKIRRKTMKHKRLSPALVSICVIALLSVVVYISVFSRPEIKVEQAYWAGSTAKPLIFDHHTHSTHSDGSKSIEELAELAYLGGCDAFAITDHTDALKNFSLEKLAEIEKVREKYPVMKIFAGLEVGMPSYFQREHVNVITTPSFEDDVINATMAALTKVEELEKPEWDLSVLNAIQAVPKASRHTIAIYNHPSRKDLNENGDENYSDIQIWNKDFQHIKAVAGAPGHQNKVEIGSYETNIKAIDRWDPFVAVVGGTWDRLLSEGMHIWGAIASSDYHNDSMDFPPCAFSRIHVSVPSHSYEGIIQGLKAGTFWADHGKILDDYRFSVSAGESKLTAFHGGSLQLNGAKDVLEVKLRVKVAEQYQNEYFRSDIITNCGSESAKVNSKLLAPKEESMSLLLPISASSQKSKHCYLRSRVSLESNDGDRLSAYSNPIFIEF